jgi:small subunit ribosomal protein S13
MPRISGVNIPNQKQIIIAIQYIYGIGSTASKKILEAAKIDPTKKAGDLTTEEISRIQEIITKNHRVEGDLRKDKMISIKRLREIGCWRGGRHAKGLPVRGQTTRVNSRTVRGNLRKTVGSGRKAAPAST